MSEHFPGQERENNTADTENYPIEAGGIDGQNIIGPAETPFAAQQVPKDERVADALSDIHSQYSDTEAKVEGDGQRDAEALKAQHLQNAAEILKRVVGEFSRDGESSMISKSTREHVGTLIIDAHTELQAALDGGGSQEELLNVYRRLGQLCDEAKGGSLREYSHRKYDLMFLVMNEVDDLERLIKLSAPTELSAGAPVPPEATRRPKPSRWKRFF